MKQILALFIASLFLGNAYSEDNHSAHHSKAIEETKGHAAKSLSLNHGKKWNVDQTMKERMEAIHLQVNKLKSLINSKKASAVDYSDLAITISDSAQKIAANCKMEQKQDETFHTILGDLLAASDDLKDSKKSKSALEMVEHALSIYSEYFEQKF
jgi:rubrerythrin